ncbi:MAG: DUF721 domain-containing protein [Deltaproteobacteria bacterium]|nr:DUF721 domain-containing protein [Deltaproteobacteria bacterium]
MKPAGPKRLSLLLEQALARLGLDRRLDDYRVWQAWDEVVGQTISRNAQPVRLDGDRLVVVVRTSSWLQELSLLQRELIARINGWMGRPVVKDLFFVVGRVEEPDTPAPAAQRQAPPAAHAAVKAAVATTPPREGLGELSGMNPETAAAFERLWSSARRRGHGGDD